VSLSNIGNAEVVAARDHFVMPNPVPDRPTGPPTDEPSGPLSDEAAAEGGSGWRTVVRRLPELAVGERAEIERILDAGVVAHVGVAVDDRPYVLPMAYARIGTDLYLHGSVASRLVRALGSGARVCVTVTVLDGIVLARSAFNTSMNYRSVMVMGETETVFDPDDRARVFEALLERLVPGRYATVRAPNESELRQTLVVRLPIDVWSAKVSAGPPDDDPEDLSFPVWAGEIPLRLVAGRPVAAPGLTAGLLVDAPVVGSPGAGWSSPWSSP
jgi:nitroimidazol reductase NimA-like FMN-containing flavoprotein (pyridoxamine 5'-phosphate oxidase superfamily)